MGTSGFNTPEGVVRSLLHMKLCKRLLTSLISRPSHRPVFDRLQIITNWTVGRPGNEANFLPHLATLVSSGSLLIDSECGKKENKHFIALVEGDCYSVSSSHHTSGFQSIKSQ